MTESRGSPTGRIVCAAVVVLGLDFVWTVQTAHSAEPSVSRGMENGGGAKSSVAAGSPGAGIPLMEEASLIAVLKDEAARGNANAQYELGVRLMRGQGVKKDMGEGARLWILAAEAGHVAAQRNLAVTFMRGEGVKVDVERAVHWTREAARQGDAVAMHNLAVMYQHGTGVPKDVRMMMMWFERAALAGDVNSQRHLGARYSSGMDGIGVDQKEACRWFAMGAEQDDCDCLVGLGLAYYGGQGVWQDIAEAVRLWRRAAEQGHAKAQALMGVALSEGIGVATDDLAAYVWFKLAANQGEEAGRLSSARMAALLTKRQLAQAREIIAAFKPRGPRPSATAKVAPERGSPAVTEPVMPAPPAPPRHGENDEGILTGTGFFITASGYIVTNYHVIGVGRTLHTVEGKDKTWPARLVAHDKGADLAVLKVEVSAHACLPVITSEHVKLGATVATVGFPNPDIQGMAPKLAKGDIAALSGAFDDPDRFQISVPVQPGNSGGSLVDARGNVVGIVCGILNQDVALAATGTLANNVAYAIKSTKLLQLLKSVPGISAQLPEARVDGRVFEDVVEAVQNATVMIIAE